MKTIFRQPSFTLESDRVSLAVSQTGGQLAPVEFKLGTRRIQPFSIAPWWNEKLDLPPILGVLRGDFFCLPFGGNSTPWRGEKHPIHGETANRSWQWVDQFTHNGRTLLHLTLNTKVRTGVVDKFIELRQGHNAVYQRHVISGMNGPMNLGHHAMLKFNSPGRISTSPIIGGKVFPNFEDPAAGGYSSLKGGATFRSLDRVPLATGGWTDASSYPARDGFEDLLMVSSKPDVPLAWSAVVFPEEGYLWISLRDPRTLTGTILWHSNGGRHYAPWNGRHRAVLGVEDVTSFFHLGLAESARDNEFSRKGIPTTVQLSKKTPTVINYIMAVASVPRTFQHVKQVRLTNASQVTIVDRKGASVKLAVEVDYLRNNHR